MAYGELTAPIGLASLLETDNALCASCETDWRGMLLKHSALLGFSAPMAAMHDYLAKAHENLAGAESELQHGRTNSCARSAYYACFHAAIAALLQAGLTPPEPARGWRHDWVHASFVGQLIQRRKIYPANLPGPCQTCLPCAIRLTIAPHMSVSEKRSRRCVVRRPWSRPSRHTSKGGKDLDERQAVER